jgi:hypothetical protein
MDPPAGIPLNSYNAIGNRALTKIIFERDLYPGGFIGYLIHFPDEEMIDNYTQSMTKIKSHANDFRLMLKSRRIDQVEINRIMHDDWLPMVKEFISTFGAEYVPPDVRSMLNDLQRELRLDITVFDKDDIVSLNW